MTKKEIRKTVTLDLIPRASCTRNQGMCSLLNADKPQDSKHLPLLHLDVACPLNLKDKKGNWWNCKFRKDISLIQHKKVWTRKVWNLEFKPKWELKPFFFPSFLRALPFHLSCWIFLHLRGSFRWLAAKSPKSIKLNSSSSSCLPASVLLLLNKSCRLTWTPPRKLPKRYTLLTPSNEPTWSQPLITLATCPV